jgi:hypothetical protein
MNQKIEDRLKILKKWENRITKEELIKYYSNTDYNKRRVATILGCSNYAITHLLKFYNIPEKPKNRCANGKYPHYLKILQNHIGRKINKDEECHHIDGDRENDNINNLNLMKSIDHQSYHTWLYDKYIKPIEMKYTNKNTLNEWLKLNNKPILD